MQSFGILTPNLVCVIVNNTDPTRSIWWQRHLLVKDDKQLRNYNQIQVIVFMGFQPFCLKSSIIVFGY